MKYSLFINFNLFFIKYFTKNLIKIKSLLNHSELSINLKEKILKYIDNHDAKALAKGMISNITSGRDTLLYAYQKIQSLWE